MLNNYFKQFKVKPNQMICNIIEYLDYLSEHHPKFISFHIIDDDPFILYDDLDFINEKLSSKFKTDLETAGIDGGSLEVYNFCDSCDDIILLEEFHTITNGEYTCHKCIEKTSKRIHKNHKYQYLDHVGNRIYEIIPEKKHIDNIYQLINQYCKDNGVNLAYDDRAEWFIDSITKYIDESKKED